MYRLLILALVICSTNASPRNRIHRGNASTIEEAPYMVSIYEKSAGTEICGGSIISPKFVLTAAHCFMGSSDPKDYTVRVGSTKWAEGGQEREVEYFYQHEDYYLTRDFTPRNDIALIRVSKPFDIDNVTTKIVEVFDKDQEVSEGQKGFLTGWGSTENVVSPAKLSSLSVRVISKDVCNKNYADGGGLGDNQFCATHPGGYDKEFCNGDSGSPLVINGKQAGLVSYSGPGCAEKDRPGVYTEVAKYHEWIDEQLEFDLKFYEFVLSQQNV